MVLKQRAAVFCQRLHIFNTLNFYIHWHVNLILVVSILNQNLLLRKYRFHQKNSPLPEGLTYPLQQHGKKIRSLSRKQLAFITEWHQVEVSIPQFELHLLKWLTIIWTYTEDEKTLHFNKSSNSCSSRGEVQRSTVHNDRKSHEKSVAGALASRQAFMES